MLHGNGLQFRRSVVPRCLCTRHWMRTFALKIMPRCLKDADWIKQIIGFYIANASDSFVVFSAEEKQAVQFTLINECFLDIRKEKVFIKIWFSFVLSISVLFCFFVFWEHLGSEYDNDSSDVAWCQTAKQSQSKTCKCTIYGFQFYLTSSSQLLL